MCEFVTVALPEGKRDFLRAALPRSVWMNPYDNIDLRAQLHPGDDLIALGAGECGCSLFSSDDSPDMTDQQTLHRREAKYLKKGWSRAKVERALAQTASSQVEVERFLGVRPDVREALATVSAELSCLHIFVHYFRGSMADAKFRSVDQRKIGRESLRLGLEVVELDRLYSVVA